MRARQWDQYAFEKYVKNITRDIEYSIGKEMCQEKEGNIHKI